MPFPWELNLDRPYRHEKWRFPEQRARGDTVAGDSAEKRNAFPADNAERQEITEASD